MVFSVLRVRHDLEEEEVPFSPILALIEILVDAQHLLQQHPSLQRYPCALVVIHPFGAIQKMVAFCWILPSSCFQMMVGESRRLGIQSSGACLQRTLIQNAYDEGPVDPLRCHRLHLPVLLMG